MGDPQIILLNGRYYDALTGKMIENDDPKIKSLTEHSDVKQGATHRSIDGFNRVQKSQVLNRQYLKKREGDKEHEEHHHFSHSTAPHTERHLEHSKTLMRKTVPRPAFHHPKETPQAPEPKPNPIAPARQAIVNQARAVRQSNFASKINEFTAPNRPARTNPEAIQTSSNSEVHLKNLEKLAQIEESPIDDSEILAAVASKVGETPKTLPKRKKANFIERFAKRLDIKVSTLLTISVIIIVIVALAVLTYLFLNNIELFMANARTDVDTSLPSYVPSDYSLKSVGYSTGVPATITFKYGQKSDPVNLYNISESSSDLDNQAVIDTLLTPVVGTDFQTDQVGGRTVFFYRANTDVIWVTGGIYYHITDVGNLSKNQLTQIISGT